MEESPKALKTLRRMNTSRNGLKPDEMKSVHEKKTFELVKLPEGKRALKNKWVFRIKHEEHNLRP